LRTRVAWFLSGLGLAGAVALRLVRRRSREAPLEESPAAEPDTRADELRRRLEESRSVMAERDDFESGETPVDRADPGEDPDARRRRVHEEGRAAADRMRGER
jgi:hypothetical protein